MSENIRESIPTSSDRRSNRPTKRQAITPVSEQSRKLEALFANPDQALIPTTGAKLLAPPPEIVANVQGSSAGAGSGEFHVYKASRRREYERLRVMDEEKESEESALMYEARREEMRRLDEAKTSKNRAKREKQRARRGRGQAKTGPKTDGGGDKVKLKANTLIAAGPEPDAESATHDQPAVAAEQEAAGIVIHDEDED